MKNFALAIVLAFCECTHGAKLSEQPEQVKLQIQSWVPVGTSLADAKRIMEQHQFQCLMMTNSSFGDLKSADFLYCDRRDSDSLITPIVIKRWQVALVSSEGKISTVKASFGLIGP